MKRTPIEVGACALTVLVALAVAVAPPASTTPRSGTLRIAARATKATIRSDHETRMTFALSWARDWNNWAEAHEVPQHILTVGCNYLATERYYLCAVQVSLGPPQVSVDPPSGPGISCGLIVVSATMEAGPNDRIVNGLKTTCHIFSTYPRHVVSSRRPKSPGRLELPEGSTPRRGSATN